MRAASIDEPGDREHTLGKDVDKLLQKKILAVGVSRRLHQRTCPIARCG